MAIDFKKLRENAAKNDAETTKQYYDKMGKGVVRDLTEGEKADLRTATEKSAGNIRAFGGTGMGQQTLTDNEKTARDQNALNIMADSGLQRFMAGFGEGLTPFKVNVILTGVENAAADVNGDDEINIADINAIINLILL